MKTAKLSKPMERALALAEEKGSLVRRPGGYWTPPGEPMEGLALNMRPIRGMDRYVPSHTVNALRDRGLLTGSKWNEPAEFPGSRADNQRRAFHEGTMYAAAEAYDAWLSNPTPETYARAAELGLAEFYAEIAPTLPDVGAMRSRAQQKVNSYYGP